MGRAASTYGTRRPSGLTASVPTRIPAPPSCRESRKAITSACDEVSRNPVRSGRVAWAPSGPARPVRTSAEITRVAVGTEATSPGACHDRRPVSAGAETPIHTPSRPLGRPVRGRTGERDLSVASAGRRGGAWEDCHDPDRDQRGGGKGGPAGDGPPGRGDGDRTRRVSLTPAGRDPAGRLRPSHAALGGGEERAVLTRARAVSCPPALAASSAPPPSP